MNFFLSKYYLLEKATLPELISAQTIEALAQRDIPGIFMAMKPSDATLTDEQVHADDQQDGRRSLALFGPAAPLGPGDRRSSPPRSVCGWRSPRTP